MNEKLAVLAVILGTWTDHGLSTDIVVLFFFAAAVCVGDQA